MDSAYRTCSTRIAIIIIDAKRRCRAGPAQRDHSQRRLRRRTGAPGKGDSVLKNLRGKPQCEAERRNANEGSDLAPAASRRGHLPLFVSRVCPLPPHHHHVPARDRQPAALDFVFACPPQRCTVQVTKTQGRALSCLSLAFPSFFGALSTIVLPRAYLARHGATTKGQCGAS